MKVFISLCMGIMLLLSLQIFSGGCGQIMAPTGGPRDTIPPKLLIASPENRTTNFKGKKIVLEFDEYVQVDQLQQNLLVSPSPKMTPYVDYKFKTVTIKLRDTLEPNTTYVINLGNAIKDLNEGNVFKNFSYVFSTGTYIDSLECKGRVLIAETGKVDSTLIVLLYKNGADSAVEKQKPNYIAHLDGDGNFTIHNLAPGIYKVYALKDLTGSRTYSDRKSLFAFSDMPVIVTGDTKPVVLYAYAELKDNTAEKIITADKRLKYTIKIPAETQDILSPLVIKFNKAIKNFDLQKVILTDTLNQADASAQVGIDSTGKIITIQKPWKENETYKLVISKSLSDTAGNTLSKPDTIRFKTKKEEDYGSLTINFTNLSTIKNPVLQFVLNNQVVRSFPLTSSRWSNKLFLPGEYELRILSDENNNGTWDRGNFAKKIQPEKIIPVNKKVSVRGGGWENEFDIPL